MSSEAIPFTTGTRRERIATGLTASMLLPLSVVGLYMTSHYSLAQPKDGWQSRLASIVMLSLLFEVCLAFALFSAIALLWALYKLNWAERLLVFMGSHVWHALIVLAVGSTALCAVLFVAT